MLDRQTGRNLNAYIIRIHLNSLITTLLATTNQIPKADYQVSKKLNINKRKFKLLKKYN